MNKLKENDVCVVIGNTKTYRHFGEIFGIAVVERMNSNVANCDVTWESSEAYNCSSKEYGINQDIKTSVLYKIGEL